MQSIQFVIVVPLSQASGIAALLESEGIEAKTRLVNGADAKLKQRTKRRVGRKGVPHNRIPDETAVRAAALMREGELSQRDIAEQCGISVSSLWRIAKDHGIPPKRRGRPPKEVRIKRN